MRAAAKEKRVQGWKRRRRCAGMLVLALVAAPLLGQGVPNGNTVTVPRSPLAPAVLPDWPKRDAGKLTLSGAKLEKPDLRYELQPRFLETDVGNAAVPYYLAVAKLPALPAGERETIIQEVARDATLQSLDGNDLRLKGALAEFDASLKLLHDGARMDHVDWQLPIRTQGVTLQLPHLGQLRWLSSALVIKARLAIKAHEWNAAQQYLQTGYTLARHLGEGDTLIESLVGVSIARAMNACVQDWVAEPGSPNLYWPLTNLPAPFNNFRKAMAGERDFALMAMPELKHFRAGQFSVAEWDSAMAKLKSLSGMTLVAANEELPAGETLVLGTAAAMAMYPQAKAFLRERGASAEAVEKMPVAEALGRYFVQSFDEEQDDMTKWMGLPVAERAEGLREWEVTFQAAHATNQTNLLAAIMLPSVRKVVEIGVRLDREVAALRTVEAIRAYAGEKGSLPARLEDLTLPLPPDPVGKAFVYQVTGGTAVLASPAGVEGADQVHWELTLRK